MDFDFDVDAGRQFDALQAVDRLRVRVDDVDEALVDAHFEVLAGVLVDVRSTDDREAMLVGRQRDRATDRGARAGDSLDDLACRLVDDFVVKRLEADAD